MSTNADTAEARPVRSNRVAIIGSGAVGAATGYALLQSELVREIVLLDSAPEKAEGEAMDLEHAVPLGPPVAVWAGDYDDAAASAVAVITAGATSKPGESRSRLDLVGQNAPIVRECVGELVKRGFGGVVVMTSNPVDVLAQVAQEDGGLPWQRVIGSGTVLDTARLRQLLADTLRVEARAVDAFILGEHGDSEIAVWSGARVAGVPLGEFAGPDVTLDLADLLRRVREAGPAVAERKGNTSYAIATCVRRICEAVLRDERAVLPVSTRLSGQYGIDGVYLSLPCVVGAGGVERVIELPLSDDERDGLRASADVLRKARDEARA